MNRLVVVCFSAPFIVFRGPSILSSRKPLCGCITINHPRWDYTTASFHPRYNNLKPELLEIFFHRRLTINFRLIIGITLSTAINRYIDADIQLYLSISLLHQTNIMYKIGFCGKFYKFAIRRILYLNMIITAAILIGPSQVVGKFQIRG